ncbi:HutD/Ves family protein [Paracoccus zhejiangensis]|nr:HutD family protein [Paracoccus zhejiangensis]
MRLIRPEDFQTQQWKNGGGVTHEIARQEREGQLQWRLSIAEVGSDGPFSAFPGLSRILTVIEGPGLVLQTPDVTMMALPMQPLAFSGDLPIDSRLIDGPVRDFNLIHDGARFDGSVLPLSGDRTLTTGATHAVLALGDGISVDGTPLPQDAVALVEGAAQIQAPAAIRGLVATLIPRQTPKAMP